MSAELTPARLSALAASLYVEGPVLMRLLQKYRPYICPFELVIESVPAGARVLDIGCGGGLLLALLAGSGRISAGVGFDVSVPAIATAKAMVPRLAAAGHRAELSFIRLDVHEPWPEGTFGSVCLIDVMHHVPVTAQRSVIEQAAAKVAPGGVLVYKDMCRRPWWRACANRCHDLVLARQWIHYAPVESVEEWTLASGLVLDRTTDAGRWWYGHELRVFRRPG